MINVRLRQSNHNHNHNYNVMGFDTIEINLVLFENQICKDRDVQYNLRIWGEKCHMEKVTVTFVTVITHNRSLTKTMYQPLICAANMQNTYFCAGTRFLIQKCLYTIFLSSAHLSRHIWRKKTPGSQCTWGNDEKIYFHPHILRFLPNSRGHPAPIWVTRYGHPTLI